MILGSISVLTMVTAMILKLGQADFEKYIGFSMIMIAIGVTRTVMERFIILSASCDI